MAKVSKRLEEGLDRVRKRALCYAAESTLANEQTRNDLSLQAAGLHEHYWIVLARSLDGRGKAEETRTLPAIASNYARLLEKLGVTADKLKPEDEDL